jgi:nicotinamidase-related amidase
LHIYFFLKAISEEPKKEMNMLKKALIIIDMINDFIDEKGALYYGETARAIVPFIQKRLKEYREKGDLVIFLQDNHNQNDRKFDRFPPHAIEGTWGSRIIPDLAPQHGETITPKKRFNGFYGTDLEHILSSARIQEVEVVGVRTSTCVMDTVGRLTDRDYEVVVPPEGVADFDPEAHDLSLKRMKQVYGARI